MPTKRSAPAPDPVAPERDVEDDPRVQKARQRLRDVNDAAAVEDDEAEAPSAPTNGDGEARPRLKGGWAAAQQTQDSTSSWAQSFKPEEKSQIIKFLEDIPYVSYARHWIERTTAAGRGLRAYTCYKSFDTKKECPLCKAGDRPTAVSCFNIVVLDSSGEMIRRSWDVGSRLLQVLKGYSNDPRIAPLTKGFFLVSKTGNKATTQYNVSAVRASALEEDYDIPVPDPADLAAVERYTPEIVEITPIKTLREIADELTDEYD